MELDEKKARLKHQVAVLRKRQSVRFALLNTLVFLVFGFLVEALVTMAVEKRTIAEFLRQYWWWKLLFLGVSWFLFSYFWLSRASRKLLHKKETELQQLEKDPSA